jgi:hypothetical protein
MRSATRIAVPRSEARATRDADCGAVEGAAVLDITEEHGMQRLRG